MTCRKVNKSLEVLELFAEAQSIVSARVSDIWARRFARLGARQAEENEAKRRRRGIMRLARAHRRGPCPGCGQPVTRDEHSHGRIPTYCSHKCMRKQIEARRKQRKISANHP